MRPYVSSTARRPQRGTAAFGVRTTQTPDSPVARCAAGIIVGMKATHKIRGLNRRLTRLFREGYGVARVKLGRHRALGASEVPGVTVITANWNTLPFLEVLIKAVQSRSPAGTRVLVVDNGSTDGSREFLRSRSDVDYILLPVNVGHGTALDLGVAKARTETIAILDVDAFPISDEWLVEAEAALDSGKRLCGAYIHRSYIHPCFLVATRRTLLVQGPSLRARGRYPKDGRRRLGVFLDTAEGLSQALTVRYGSSSLHRIEISSIDGPGLYGTVFGKVLYHNFHATTGKDRQAGLDQFLSAAKRYESRGSDEGPFTEGCSEGID